MSRPGSTVLREAVVHQLQPGPGGARTAGKPGATVVASKPARALSLPTPSMKTAREGAVGATAGRGEIRWSHGQAASASQHPKPKSTLTLPVDQLPGYDRLTPQHPARSDLILPRPRRNRHDGR